MRYPLSPVLADLFMEEFELDSIEKVNLCPNLWLRYINDTFVVRPYDKTALQEFFHHLNSQHPHIQFTMEQEQNNTISVLDVQVTRQADGTIAQTVHRKPKYPDRYLHNSSFHHPRFKSAVCNTLVCWAFNTCDKGSLKQELHHIKTSLQLNDYKTFNLSQPKPSLTTDEQPEFKAAITLPYIGHTSHKFQSIFSQAQVKIFHTAPNKIQASLHTHKDKRDTQDKAGVYRIPCDCGKVYFAETWRSISTRIKDTKHMADWDTSTNQPSSNIHKNTTTSSIGIKPNSKLLYSPDTNAESGRPSRYKHIIKFHET